MFYPNGREYGDYTHLKYRKDRASAIYFTKWLENIVLNEKYLLNITYFNLEGSEKSVQISYEAVKRIRNELVSTAALIKSQ
jgi:hypothetical protein